MVGVVVVIIVAMDSKTSCAPLRRMNLLQRKRGQKVAGKPAAQMRSARLRFAVWKVVFGWHRLP